MTEAARFWPPLCFFDAVAPTHYAKAIGTDGMRDDELQLSHEPRGGYYYGWVEHNGELVRVYVLPPAHLWRGDVQLEGWKPDARAWIVYLKGREFARVERREDIAVALGTGGAVTVVGRLLRRVRRLLPLGRHR